MTLAQAEMQLCTTTYLWLLVAQVEQSSYLPTLQYAETSKLDLPRGLQALHHQLLQIFREICGPKLDALTSIQCPIKM